MLTLTVSGSISDYSDTSSLQQVIATAAGVDKSLVTIEVAAASVIVTATIAVPASTTATTMQASLSSSLGTAAAASNALGITVESVPMVALRDSEARIESEDGEGGLSAAAIAGITVGALALGSLLGGWLVCRMCVRKREVAKRMNSQLSGVPTQNRLGVEVVLDGTEIAERRVDEAGKRDRV